MEILSVQIVDKYGNVCPNYDCKLELDISGAELLAVDNADILAHETSHKSAVFNTYQGRMTAYVRCEKEADMKILIKPSKEQATVWYTPGHEKWQ